MKRFCRDSMVLNLEKADLFSDIFEKILVQIKNANAQRGTLNNMLASHMVSLCRLSPRYSSWVPAYKVSYKYLVLIVIMSNLTYYHKSY